MLLDGSAKQDVSELSSGVHSRPRKRVIVVSPDRDFAESLRSQLAEDFDVLLARNGGEASSKHMAAPVDIVIVDISAPVLGVTAISRIKESDPKSIICALALPDVKSSQLGIAFDYTLAKPQSGADFPARIRFIVEKAERDNSRAD